MNNGWEASSMYLNTASENILDTHQKLVLTPQVRQSLQVLCMNSQELSEHIKEQALENPIMDIESVCEEMDYQEKLFKKIEWLSNSDSMYRVDNNYVQDSEDDEYPLISSDEDSLVKVLLMQLNTIKLNSRLAMTSKYIIHSLNNRGYLETSLEIIAEMSNTDIKLARRALKIVQDLEPWGVGARNLQECLIIQLKKMRISDNDVYKIILNYLEELSRNKLNTIANKLGISIEDVKKKHSIIKSLDPAPGLKYNDKEAISYIHPDITVVKFGTHYEILINDFLYPTIRINSSYRDLIHSGDESIRRYMAKKMDQAIFLMKSIMQRNKTLLEVAREIVEIQKEFMNKGPGHVVPMVLNDIADRLGLHESTVSRAVSGKYMQCIWGAFELKYFFSSAVNNSNDSMTPEKVKILLRKIIDNENRKKPLSDQKISEKLSKKIAISRRTVAKYREEMKIPNASERREY